MYISVEVGSQRPQLNIPLIFIIWSTKTNSDKNNSKKKQG